ncbi:hypothetical protein IPL68_05160 [Candidatus Saccharibacteria bacterium]|nr:MAG: hypothetical protein IPL68_05160 [Candidatus Saccharibacteria bacterium]
MDIQVLSTTLQGSSLLKIVLLGMGGFLLSMALTPLYTTVAYRWKLWKKPRTETVTGAKATVFMKLHGEKHKRHIPTMAGIIFIITVSVLTLSANWSRAETWLPLAAFVGAALIGFIDDIINLRGDGTGKAGLPSRLKMLLITIVAAVGDGISTTNLALIASRFRGLSTQSPSGGGLFRSLHSLWWRQRMP